MALTPIYRNVGPKLLMAGCPLSSTRARALLAKHSEAARSAPTKAMRDVEASLRDELLIAMARAVSGQMDALTRDIEGLAASMRASIAAEERPGAVVIPFQRRS